MPILMRLFLLAALLLAGCQDASRSSSATAPPARPAALTGAAALDTTQIAPPDSTTARLFAEAMAHARAETLHTEPLGAIMQELGLHFRGRPYAAGMLDAPPAETLVVALDRYDCVTFVETMLAMAQGVAAQDGSYPTFARHLEALRYRSGVLDGYASRLHYFSEWIADNAERGHVVDLTERLGGAPLEKQITFMTEHRDRYRHLAANDSLVRRIAVVEQDLADRDLYYIPQDRIREVYDRLQAGDVIALATNIEGLAVSHTGLVYKADGQTGLLHASLTDGVIVSPDLQAYVQNIKNQIGIVVARPQR
jgi:hypothetical protein